MTNRTDDITRPITLDAMIAYDAINYIPSTIDDDAIAEIDTIIPELRDTIADLLDDLMPTSLNESLTSDEIDHILIPHIDAILDSTDFYSRCLDIALARYRE